MRQVVRLRLLFKEKSTGRFYLAGGFFYFPGFLDPGDILHLLLDEILFILGAGFGRRRHFCVVLYPGGDFVLIFAGGTLEFSNALTQSAAYFRQPLATKNDENDDENYQKFGNTQTEHKDLFRRLSQFASLAGYASSLMKSGA